MSNIRVVNWYDAFSEAKDGETFLYASQISQWDWDRNGEYVYTEDGRFNYRICESLKVNNARSKLIRHLEPEDMTKELRAKMRLS